MFGTFKNFAKDIEFRNLISGFLGQEQKEYLEKYGSMPERWINWMKKNPEKWEAFFDACDNYFENKKRKYLLYMMNWTEFVLIITIFFFIFVVC